MSLELLKEKGTPLDRQRFTWQELAPEPYSKLNVDAFTRVRVIWVREWVAAALASAVGVTASVEEKARAQLAGASRAAPRRSSISRPLGSGRKKVARPVASAKVRRRKPSRRR